jgi:putative mycofactocin binding protein MftB
VRGLLISSLPASPTAPGAFEPAARYALDPQVALRAEPFGALAYHYGSRRLTFLRSPLLVDVVRSLPDHPTVGAAVDALVPNERRAGFLRAIASLADSRFIVPASQLATMENPMPDNALPDNALPENFAHENSENSAPENSAPEKAAPHA